MSHKCHVSIRISDKVFCHYQVDCDGGRVLANSISCRKHERAYVAGSCLDDQYALSKLKVNYARYVHFCQRYIFIKHSTLTYSTTNKWKELISSFSRPGLVKFNKLYTEKGRYCSFGPPLLCVNVSLIQRNAWASLLYLNFLTYFGKSKRVRERDNST